jgi:hypothetical protein
VPKQLQSDKEAELHTCGRSQRRRDPRPPRIDCEGGRRARRLA